MSTTARASVRIASAAAATLFSTASMGNADAPRGVGCGRCSFKGHQGSAAWCDVRTHPKFNHDWDLRHPVDTSVAIQGPTRVMLLVRHGQYENKGGPGYGLLTEVGRQQAKHAGQHIVERMRVDPDFKKAVLQMTSSNVIRAIETADIMEREIVAELAWADIPVKSLPADMQLKSSDVGCDGYAEFEVTQLKEPVEIVDKDNLLQPQVRVKCGSRIRIKCPLQAPCDQKDITLLQDVALEGNIVSVFQPVADVKSLNDTYEDWECAGCGQSNPRGDVHWSDNAETNGKGFCDTCFQSESCSKLEELREKGDSVSRLTVGTLCSPFRMPNDSNLNEADVDVCTILLPTESLYKYYGEMNPQILKDHAQVDAAFYKHFHRSVDHKRVQRKDRTDTIEFSFMKRDGDEKKSAYWTAAEFEKIQLDELGVCPWILDGEGKGQVEGPFELLTLDGNCVKGKPFQDVQSLVKQELKNKAKRKKQVEIIVVHQNIIRYIFLKAMQFDTGAWLNFGGSNCTMTQLRLTARGDVICDFFGDHGSKLPVSQYTFNKQPDY